jgi:hypothetical protein
VIERLGRRPVTVRPGHAEYDGIGEV